MQVKVQGVTHNPVPRIENIDSRIFLRYPACNSGKSKKKAKNKQNQEDYKQVLEVRQVITFEHRCTIE